MAHKAGKGNDPQLLYSLILSQVARVLRPAGRCVMLTPSRTAVELVLQQQAPCWSQEDALPVNCGGQIAHVFVWRRTEEPAVPIVSTNATGSSRRKQKCKTGALDAAQTAEALAPQSRVQEGASSKATPRCKPGNYKSTCERAALQPALQMAALHATQRSVQSYLFHFGPVPWRAELDRLRKTGER